MAKDRPLETAELRRWLQQRLPEYMVPALWVRLEQLPLTASGKVDRKKLPAPERGTPSEQRYVAPRTALEEALAQIWSEVLKAGRIGVNDHFFELGGHSLLATRVMARVRETLAVEVPLRKLFDAPTIAGLALTIEETRREAQVLAQPPLAPRAPGTTVPLSFAQERLWFLDRLGLVGAAYNVPLALRLEGALDAAALERAIGEVIRRHESLRTRFEYRDGQSVQVIEPAGASGLPIEDLGTLEE